MKPSSQPRPARRPSSDPDASLRLVVVDDEDLVRRMLCAHLKACGFSVFEARSGEEALTLVAQHTIDVVVSDIRMPKMDGMELLRRIATEWPDVDVVMITAYNMSYSYADVVNAGATDFVIKPFEPEELRAKLLRIGRERSARRELLFHSTRDGLTGLGNRRTFEETLRREVDRAHRQGHPMALLILDVDNLKYYNDAHGHVAGDALLRSVAKCLEQGLRQGVDTPFRIGGDEFAATLVEADETQALTIGERIRELFGEKNGHQDTVSIGVAALAPTDDPESLHLRADSALYMGKTAGGDRVVEAACPPDSREAD